MIKKDLWTISVEDSGVCFKYGYEEVAIFQGNFRRFNGILLADKKLKALDFMLNVEAESVKAADSNHNPILLSHSYFDSAGYPTIHFHSARMDQPDDGRPVIVQLTLKGIMRPVSLTIINVELIPHVAEHRLLLVAKVALSASEFQVGVREMYDPDNKLIFEVQLILTRPL